MSIIPRCDRYAVIGKEAQTSDVQHSENWITLGARVRFVALHEGWLAYVPGLGFAKNIEAL